MRRLTGLAIRISCTLILTMVVTSYIFTRSTMACSKLGWATIGLRPPGIQLTLNKPHETDVRHYTLKRSSVYDVFYGDVFSLTEADGVCTFPGGWMDDWSVLNDINYRVNVCLRYTLLLSSAAGLNILVHGLWWLKKRRTALREDSS